MANLKILDPVQGLVDYVLDIKPYHTKIMEVLVEYVHTELVDVTVIDETHMDIQLLASTDTIIVCEESGFDSAGWDEGRLLITSPNQGITFEDYPAVNTSTNSVIINGNHVKDIKVGDTVYISSFIHDYRNVYKITGANPGSAGTASFVIKEGSVPAEFIAGYTFRVYDAGVNNGTYSVAAGSPGPVSDGTYTTIPVVQSVPSNNPAGHLGLVISSDTNNGYFTVNQVSYNGGMIDSWPDYSDLSSYTLGNEPHTIVTLTEALSTPTPLTGSPVENLVHVTRMALQPIPIERAFPYSKTNKTYTAGSPASLLSEPDEGSNRESIVGVKLSGVGSPSYGTFTVSGNYGDSNVETGHVFTVDSSSGNNGTYTIVSITYDSLADETTFGVSESVTNATVDGYMNIFVPSNMFVIDDNRVAQFIQGRQFDVQGGSLEATYTVLNSRLVDGKTYVRVAEQIFDFAVGNTIVGINNGFVVPGNQTTKYPVGTTFVVVDSYGNNGTYVVAGSPGPVYDPASGTTTIPVAETLDSTPGGQMMVSLVGYFYQHTYGFDEVSPICSMIPESVLSVYIMENISFSGLGLDLSDDIIAYNMENTDPGGFDIPINTILSATEPTIVEAGTQPYAMGSPAQIYQELWFDTSKNVLKQWVGRLNGWEPVKKAWWLDSTNNLLYYRVKHAAIDTGWVLDSIRDPGYSDFLSASSVTELVGKEGFVASEVSPGVAEDTYTLTTLTVPGSPPDAYKLKVFVNDLPAGFTLNSATEFTITSPILLAGDIVTAKVYDATGTSLNAHVEGYDVIPHSVYHYGVGVDESINAYVISGGNFIERFAPFNGVTGYSNGGSPAVIGERGTWNATTYPIWEVDGVGNSFTIFGDHTELFSAGRVMRVNPSENNYYDFNILSSVAWGSPVQTTITVLETVTETGITISGSPFAGSPIPVSENYYSRDFGVIMGAVYEPTPNPVGSPVNSIYNTGQPKTIFVPSTTVDSYVDAIMYLWIGPVRFDIGLSPTDLTRMGITDTLGIANEVLGLPDTLTIYDTNVGSGSPAALNNTFVLHYDDPVLGVPVDLGDALSAGTIFTVAGSYSNGVPSTIETNDAMYVVKATSFDYTEAGSPAMPWVGSGDTTITIETDYDQMPPYGSFTVVDASNHYIGSPFAGSPLTDKQSTITLSGNHYTLLSSFMISGTAKFRLDVPLVNTNSLYNIITVTGIELVGGNTVLTIQEELIDETYTGSIGIIDAKYRAQIYFDEDNTTGSPTTFEHGKIVRKIYLVGAAPENAARAQILDELMFGWGDVLRWPIIDVNAAGSPNGSSVSLYGDYSAIIQPSDRVEIKGGVGAGGSPAHSINGQYNVQTVSYNPVTGISVVQLYHPVITIDPPAVNVNVTILSTGVGSPSTRTLVIDGEDGLHVNFLRPGTTFKVTGGGSPLIVPNEGTYTVVSAVHDSVTDTITITTVEDIPSDDASGYVQYTKKEAGYLEMEGVDITPWFQYTIKDIRPITSEIILNGNATGDVMLGQEVRALGTLANDSIYTTANAPTFNALTNTTTLPVAEPLSYGEAPIAEILDTNLIKVVGNAAFYLGAGKGGSPNAPWGGAGSPIGPIGGGSPNVGDQVFITGSTGNDGTYTVRAASYDGNYSYITLTTDLSSPVADGTFQFRDKGGWIESLRYQGISLRFTDFVGVDIVEVAEAAVINTSGSIVGSWDYPLWDVGSFDEGIEATIHLYSNVF